MARIRQARQSWRHRAHQFRRFRAFRRGHRVQLRPFWWWLGAHVHAALYAVLGLGGLAWRGLLLVVVAVVVVLLGRRLSPRWNATRAVWFRFTGSQRDASTDTMLDRRTEGVYYLASLAVSTLTSVLLATYWRGAVTPWEVPGRVLVGLAASAGATLVWAAPFWWHHFGGTWGTDTFHQKWVRVANNPDLPGFTGSVSLPRETRKVAGGVQLVVKLRAGLTAEAVTQTGNELAGVFGVREGGVTLTKAAGRPPNYATVRIVPRDPWPAVLPHPALAGVGPIELDSFESNPVVPLGLAEDGTVITWKLFHLAVVGSTGKGKSIALNSLVVSLLRLRDVAPLIVDPDRVSFTSVERLLAAPIASLENAADLIAGVRAIVDRRLRRFERLAADGKDVETLPVSPNFPAVPLIIDEFPKVVSALINGHPDGKAAGQAVRRDLEVIVREGRKVRVFLVLAVQDPTGKEDFGSAQIKAQMEILGLGLKADRQQYAWAALTRSGYTTTGFGPGEFLLHALGHEEPHRRKGFLVTKKDLRAAGTRMDVSDRPPLDTDSLDALAARYAAAGGDHEPGSGMVALPSPRGRATNPVERVAVLLAECGRPMRRAEMLAASGMPETSLTRVLSALEGEGRVHRRAKGWWVDGPAPVSDR